MFYTMNQRNMSSQLRTAVLEAPMSRYKLAIATGVSESSISKFIHGKSGLSIKSIDSIWSELGLQLQLPKENHNGNTR